MNLAKTLLAEAQAATLGVRGEQVTFRGEKMRAVVVVAPLMAGEAQNVYEVAQSTVYFPVSAVSKEPNETEYLVDESGRTHRIAGASRTDRWWVCPCEMSKAIPDVHD